MFPNWADTKTFYPVQQEMLLKKQFGFRASDKVILYSGAIGEKQGLQSLLHTAYELRHRLKVKFVICGSGPYKEKLIALAKKMGLKNVIFMPLQKTEVFNQFLNMADLHLVLQKANANDLVMPSKLTTILSVGGLVLVTASKGTSLHSIISEHQMGILIESGDQVALTGAIKKAIDDTHDHMKVNARDFAEKNLAIDKVVACYLSAIMKEAKSPENVKSSQPLNNVNTFNEALPQKLL